MPAPTPAPRPHPDCPLVVAYGLGVDSTALLVEFARREICPDQILFADTGGEKPETYQYLAVIRPYLARVGLRRPGPLEPFSLPQKEELSVMPHVVTTVHDPVALAATCRRLGLPPPEEGCVRLGPLEATGWVVRLNGLHAPLVFSTLTGLVAYHPRDNAFAPFARIARLVLRYYDVRAALRRGDSSAGRRPDGRRRRRVLAPEVA